MRKRTKYLYTTKTGARAHRDKVEIILGKKLPLAAVIHHRNNNGQDNSNTNLIVCENEGYHNLIELREAAYRATGDANKRKCAICKQYDNVDNMLHKLRYRKSQGSGIYRHAACHTDYERKRRNVK